jgi:hypothetical protein
MCLKRLKREQERLKRELRKRELKKLKRELNLEFSRNTTELLNPSFKKHNSLAATAVAFGVERHERNTGRCEWCPVRQSGVPISKASRNTDCVAFDGKRGT